MALPPQPIIERRRDQMFPVLDQAEIERMRRFGEVRTFAENEAVFTTGQIGPGSSIFDSDNANLAIGGTWTLAFLSSGTNGFLYATGISENGMSAFSLGPTGAFNIYNNLGSSDVVVDVNGYFDVQSSAGPAVPASHATATPQFRTPVHLPTPAH